MSSRNTARKTAGRPANSAVVTRKRRRRDVKPLFVNLETPVSEVVQVIDRSGRVSIALVVDEDGRLLNTISDGDVRRGILGGYSFQTPVSELLPIKARTPHPLPVTAPASADDARLLQIMQRSRVRQVPLLDSDGVVVDIAVLSDYLEQPLMPLSAVVMAGGLGMRLRPLTEAVPKPLLPVAGRPLMERLIEQLRESGVRRVGITTHYQAQKIVDHFGDGHALGVDINYFNERLPLGTVGALGLMPPPDGPLLVINGDILTQVDFRAMLAYHVDHNAKMTVAVRRYEMEVPYGVVDCDGPAVRALREKPQLAFFVNAGIYLLDPCVWRHISPNVFMNMTDLISKLVATGERVVSFPICEYWLDVGQHADYARAQEDVLTGKYSA